MHAACCFCARYEPIPGTDRINLLGVGIGGFRTREPPIDVTIAVLVTIALGEDRRTTLKVFHVGPDGSDAWLADLNLTPDGHELQAWFAMRRPAAFPIGPNQIDVRANGQTLCSLPFRMES